MDETPSSYSYKVTCASCGKETLEVREIYAQVPHFGTMVLVSMLCSNCGYRVYDSISLEHKGPQRIEYKVNNLRDLSARVIRSSSASLTIPELGLELKPGPRSDAFVTNVEGLLDRFLAVAEQLMASSASKSKAKATIEKIHLAMNGNLPFNVVIEDETGNSAIISEDST